MVRPNCKLIVELCQVHPYATGLPLRITDYGA